MSSDAFEHISDPRGVLEVTWRALRSDGRFAITFGDPWYHPHGSHMQFFTKLPWVHVLFSEPTIMHVRSRFRDDGATRYGEVRGGLNQMTVRRFVSLITRSGYRLERLEFQAIKGLDVLTLVPGLREFMTNRVSALLRTP